MCLRKYSESWKNEKYGRLPDKNYLIPHFGQRKLLLTEVEFLTKYGKKSNIVVYAGAAPGYHIEMLAELFPHEFHLYDPRPFGKFSSPKIKCFNKYFTESVAELYNSAVLFISDIRTSGENKEEEVLFNLKQQEKWCEIMEPVAASLKFRLPFGSKEKVKYFSGDIILQPWVGIDSAETRLFTNCKEKKYYDPVDYEEKMYFFNKNLRLGPFKHNLNVKGFDFCNDCCSEIKIWSEIGDPEKLINRATEITKQNPDIGPHGKYKELPLEKRQELLSDKIKRWIVIYNKNEKIKEKSNKETKRNKKK